MDYITLLGAEQVQDAANVMRKAAETFGSAVGSQHYNLEQHQRFMDDWLQRFQQVLEEAENARRKI